MPTNNAILNFAKNTPTPQNTEIKGVFSIRYGLILRLLKYSTLLKGTVKLSNGGMFVVICHLLAEPIEAFQLVKEGKIFERKKLDKITVNFGVEILNNKKSM